jgi:DNA polymerase III delta subunit
MSVSLPLLRRFLYVSELAPAMPSTVVGQILRQSRDRNHRLKLTGALLFDGERFCQLLEGEPDTAQALMQRIERDKRHHNVKMLLDTLSAAPRMMTQWQCGYADHETFDAIDAAAARDPEKAAHTFLKLLPTCDLSS